tara:strand:+ start:6416 stop:6592 length:177 start_codon:yes stop_codon:yes gene_type:complete
MVKLFKILGYAAILFLMYAIGFFAGAISGIEATESECQVTIERWCSQTPKLYKEEVDI